MAAVVDSVDAARALSRWLTDPARGRPVVVITTSAGARRPWVDVQAVEDGVGSLADVMVLPTGHLSWEFQAHLPPRTEVYGGAARVYPVDDGWLQEPRESPLRFAFGPEDGTRVADQLVIDAMGMALAAGLITERARQSPRMAGVVRGFPVPTRALVDLDDGTLANVRQELTFDGVPLARVLAAGMRVSGLLHPEGRLLDVREAAVDPSVALTSYEVGDVVLARVRSVTAESAKLDLHPAVTVSIDVADVSSSPLDELTSLFTAGEVVAARLTACGEGRWALSLLDVDDDEPVRRAVALLEGGPPWLLPVDPAAALTAAEPVDEWPLPAQHEQPLTPAALAPPAIETETVAVAPATLVDAPPRPTPALLDRRRTAAPMPPPAVESPSKLTPVSPAPPGPTVAPQLPHPPRPMPAGEPPVPGPARPPPPASGAAATRIAELKREVAQLRDQLRAYGDERSLLATQLQRRNQELERRAVQVEQLRTRVRSEVKKRERAHRAAAGVGGSGGAEAAFVDDERQFRHEVYLAWVRRIPAAEKDSRPMDDYVITQAFLSSLREVDGVDRSKVVDVVMEVVTGIADEVAGREVHQLRSGPGPSDPPVVRVSDHATCWRVALQVKSPQARRLHVWRRQGLIEFSRVVRHDDMAP